MSTDPLDPWDYELPAERVAVHPPARRDGGRLMVLPRAAGAWVDSWVRDLPSWLEPGDLLVANASRVLRARLRAERSTGGKVEVLLLRGDGDENEALLRPARRLKVGEVLRVPGGGEIKVLALPDEEGIARIAVSPSASKVMAAAGELPLPPYLGRPEEAADRERYQTVFAAHEGSVAAPTAGLHFTGDLLAALRGRGVGFATVTLHVGIGTFRPLRPEDLARGALHEERWWIASGTAEAIRRTRAQGGRVIAVGTTACRTLEAAADDRGEVQAGSGETSLFIRPPYAFRVVDGLFTNLHLPRSSLLMLVASFTGRRRLMAAYAHAVEANYRFYSYGDAMLLV